MKMTKRKNQLRNQLAVVALKTDLTLAAPTALATMEATTMPTIPTKTTIMVVPMVLAQMTLAPPLELPRATVAGLLPSQQAAIMH